MNVPVLRVGVVPELAAAIRTAENVAEYALRTVYLLRRALVRAFQPFRQFDLMLIVVYIPLPYLYPDYNEFPHPI